VTYLTVNEAAALMRRCPETIRRRIRSGDLPAARAFGDGNYLIDEADLLAPVPQRPLPLRRRRATGRFAKIAESMNRSATS